MLNPSSPIDFTILQAPQDFNALGDTELMEVLRQALAAEVAAHAAEREAQAAANAAAMTAYRVRQNVQTAQRLLLAKLSPSQAETPTQPTESIEVS